MSEAPEPRERRPDFCLVYRELVYCYGRRIGPKGVALWSYVRLHQHGGGIWKELTGYAWASRATMGRDLGIADTRTLRQALSKLKEAGLMEEVRAGDLFGPDKIKALSEAGDEAGVTLQLQPNSLLLIAHDPLTRDEFVRWDQGQQCRECAHRRGCQAYRDWQREVTEGGGEIPPPPAAGAENAGGGIPPGPGGGEIPSKPDRGEPGHDTWRLFESPSGPRRGPPARSHPASAVLAGQPKDRTAPPGRPAVPEPVMPPEPLEQRYERVLVDLRRFPDQRRKQVAILVQNLAAILGFEGGRTVPQHGDYGRVGALAKRFGPEEVWTTACRAAGREIAGDPLAYLQRCLERAAAADLSGDPPPSPKRQGQGRSLPAGQREAAREPPPRRPLPLAGDGRPGLGQAVLGAGRFRADQPPERSTYIANLVVDIGQQFGDVEHFRENDAQAHNLWRASGLEEGPFVQLVYQARQTALRLAGARNRMAYFFTVLRNLVRPDADERGTP